MTIEEEFLDFARSLRWDELPLAVRDAVRRLSADAIANAVSGRRAHDTLALERASADLYGPGGSTVIAGGTSSLVAAVGVNAFQVTAHTMCDVYRPGLCHVTPEVVPAALGVAELDECDGPTWLSAVAAGLEATTRLCDAFNYPVFRARGWHSPGVAGALGASVTTGLLSGFDVDDLAGCLGLAGSQAGGTFAAMGTMAVKFHQVRGAQAAVIAARHVRRGLRGSPEILSAADGGLLRAFCDDPRPDRLTRDLGQEWRLLDISTRPYPAASTLQSLINVLLDVTVDASDVRDVRVELPAEAYRLGGEALWESELRAMQSARFVTAGVLITGSCWTDLFDEAHRHDAVIGEFASNHVSVTRNLELPEGAVRVTVVTADGESTHSREVAQGDPRQPLSDDELLAKARRCVEGSPLDGSGLDVGRLVRLEDEPSVASFVRDLRAR